MGKSREEEYLRRMRARGYEPSLAGMDDEDIEWELNRMDNAGRQKAEPKFSQVRPGVDYDFAERIFKMFARPFDPNWKMPDMSGPEYRQTPRDDGPEIWPQPSRGNGPSRGEPVARTMEFRIGRDDAEKPELFASAPEGGQGEGGKEAGLTWSVDPLGMFPQYDAGQGSTGGSSGNGALDRYRENEVVKPSQEVPKVDRPPQVVGGDHLGYLSGMGESGNDPGTISTGDGDEGGKSYGAFQFASKKGVPGEFMTWLTTNNPDTYVKLQAAREADGGDYGPNFDATWRQFAKENPDGFLKMQYDFTKQKYYDAAAAAIKEQTGFDFTNKSYALKNVLWSRAVHHGPENVPNIVKNALNYVDLNNENEEEIIKSIYKESGSTDSKEGPYITEEAIRAKFTPSDAEELIGFARDNNLIGKPLKYFGGDVDNMMGVWKRLNITEPREALELLKKHR